MHFVVVPGWTSSGPAHWQTRLERGYRRFVRVEQDDWDRVDRESWVAALDRTVRSVSGPLFLVGHSCGSVTIAQWAAQHPTRGVVGALLVAPADVESVTAPEGIRGQAPLPTGPLPLRTHLVMSDDDPFLAPERATWLARSWGRTIESVAGAGHFATADGYGPWPRAAALVEQLSGTRLEAAPGGSHDLRHDPGDDGH